MPSSARPFVSCLCPTYGRPECVEEVIESFLRQDYRGPMELVILNDLADQTLIWSGDPRVRVVNVADRIVPLGKKFNETARLAQGDVLFVWEDDDIYLPHRISYTIDRMRGQVWHTPIAWYEHRFDEVIPARNLFHANLAVHKDLFWSIGGYHERDWAGIDTTLMADLNRRGPVSYEIPQRDAFYIYRFGTSGRAHASTFVNDGDRVSEIVSGIVEGELRSGSLARGLIRLTAGYRRDYERAVHEALVRLDQGAA